MMHSFRRMALFALGTGFMAIALSACRTDIQEAAIPGLEKDESTIASSKLKTSETTTPVARSDVANASDRGVEVNPANRRTVVRMRSGRVAVVVDAQTGTPTDVSIDFAQGNNPPNRPMGATAARATVASGSTTINLFLPGTASGDDNADESMDDDSDDSGNGNDNGADESDDSEDDNANDNSGEDSADDGSADSGDGNGNDNSADDSGDSADDSHNDNGVDDSDDSSDDSADDDSDDSGDDSSDSSSDDSSDP